MGGAFYIFLILVQMCVGYPVSDPRQYRCHSTVDVEEGTKASIQEDLQSPSCKLPNTKCPHFDKVGQNCMSCFSMESKAELKCQMSDEKTCPKLFLESGLGWNGPKEIQFSVSGCYSEYMVSAYGSIRTFLYFCELCLLECLTLYCIVWEEFNRRRRAIYVTRSCHCLMSECF